MGWTLHLIEYQDEISIIHQHGCMPVAGCRSVLKVMPSQITIVLCHVSLQTEHLHELKPKTRTHGAVLHLHPERRGNVILFWEQHFFFGSGLSMTGVNKKQGPNSWRNPPHGLVAVRRRTQWLGSKLEKQNKTKTKHEKQSSAWVNPGICVL